MKLGKLKSKKVLFATIALLLCFTTTASADYSQVRLYPAADDHYIKTTRELVLTRSGHFNVRIYNEQPHAPIHYRVENQNGSVITYGNLSGRYDNFRDYSRSVPAGKYRLFLECKDGGAYTCDATGSLDTYY